MGRQFQPVRKRRTKPIIAAVVVVLIVAGAGIYIFVLPKMKVVGEPAPDAAPRPTSDVLQWEWGCNVTVRNSGILSGTATVQATFSYNNGTADKSFTGSNSANIGGQKTGTCRVLVQIPRVDAIQSIILHNVTWTAKLA